MLAERKSQIAEDYKKAEEAKASANISKKEWKDKMEKAELEADNLIKSAENDARRKKDVIIADANKRANDIIKHAQNEAEFERVKVHEDMKNEIADVSAVLAQKILEREISMDDHRNMINSFIEEISSEEKVGTVKNGGALNNIDGNIKDSEAGDDNG